MVKQATCHRDKVNVAIYADDLEITAASNEVLENKIKPVVVAFLSMRDLELSKEKASITHIDDGFDFLDLNIREYHGKLLIKPSKANVLNLLRELRLLI